MDTRSDEPAKRIRVTSHNIDQWPKFKELLDKDKVKFDSLGRLRYLHGAPVGDLVLNRISKDGTPIYKESAAEWFDPDSPKASRFVWP